MKTKQNKKLNTRLIITVVCSLIAATALFFAFKIIVLQRYINAMNQAELVSIRTMIIDASSNIKTNTPIDAKTGDIYFPEAKLFLKNDLSTDYMATRLTYAYYAGDNDNQAYLSVSSRPVFSVSASQLYNVRNTEELFDGIPKLQSCQRGVDVVYNKLNDNEKILKGTVRLNNNKTVYLYMEESCPELNEVVNVLKKLQAY